MVWALPWQAAYLARLQHARGMLLPPLAPFATPFFTAGCHTPGPTYGRTSRDAHSIGSLDEGGEEGLHGRQVGGIACRRGMEQSTLNSAAVSSLCVQRQRVCPALLHDTSLCCRQVQLALDPKSSPVFTVPIASCIQDNHRQRRSLQKGCLRSYVTFTPELRICSAACLPTCLTGQRPTHGAGSSGSSWLGSNGSSWLGSSGSSSPGSRRHEHSSPHLVGLVHWVRRGTASGGTAARGTTARGAPACGAPTGGTAP